MVSNTTNAFDVTHTATHTLTHADISLPNRHPLPNPSWTGTFRTVLSKYPPQEVKKKKKSKHPASNRTAEPRAPRMMVQ